MFFYKALSYVSYDMDEPALLGHLDEAKNMASFILRKNAASPTVWTEIGIHGNACYSPDIWNKRSQQ